MNRVLLASLGAVVAALTASPAAAQFEGRLDYEVKGGPFSKEGKGAGSAVVWLGSGGARTEMTMKVKDGPVRDGNFVTLWRRSEPDRVYFLNDGNKTYAVFDAGKEPKDDDRHEIARLGSGKVAGYTCERVRVTYKSGSAQELCITKELGKIPAHVATDKRGISLWNDLFKAGYDGIPISWKSGGGPEDDEEFAMTLTAAKKQKVPGSLFAVPAGYKETSLMGAFGTPEQQKQMDDAMKQMQEQMKNMSPEQRKQVEEMMKKYGTGAGK